MSFEQDHPFLILLVSSEMFQNLLLDIYSHIHQTVVNGPPISLVLSLSLSLSHTHTHALTHSASSSAFFQRVALSSFSLFPCVFKFI